MNQIDERDRERVADAWLECGLEEIAGEQQPPDLSERILAAAREAKATLPFTTAMQRRQVRVPTTAPRTWLRLLAAAMLVSSALFLVVWLRRHGKDGAEASPTQPSLTDRNQLTSQDPETNDPLRSRARHEENLLAPDSAS
jgi:hypothetical protein